MLPNLEQISNLVKSAWQVNSKLQYTMTMTNILLLGILPAGLLVWAGKLVRAPTTDKQGAKRRLLLLSGILALLFITLTVAVSVHDPTTYPLQVFHSLLWALSPALCGTLAALLLCFFSSRIVRSRTMLKILSAVLAILALVAAGTTVVAIIPGFILFGALLIAIVWQIWSWAGKWYPALYTLQVILLGVSLRATDIHSPMLATPPWLASLAQTAVYFMIPATAIVVSARLLFIGQADDRPIHWRKMLLTGLLCASLLSLVGYQIMLASVWDVATDGLGSPFLLLLVSVTGIAAAMVLSWFLPGKRKLIALAFAVIAPLAMLRAQDMGTYGPSGKWGMMPTIVTEQRAETVNSAIQRYYARNGEYPPTLNDLTPLYLIYIPTPLIIPGQTWCYEGGHDYYRLGYVYRQYFSTPASVRIHAVVGEPPVAGWTCQDKAAKYPAPPGHKGS